MKSLMESFDWILGLSDKLHSIPKEAIHITPKEFSGREIKESPSFVQVNGTAKALNEEEDVIEELPGILFS